ncbi:MAG: cation transporter [Alkalinema sp. FL-bin-369]|nr:cation transporter [Leptolyngbyaceae cyanobacterium LF-bin-369]
MSHFSTEAHLLKFQPQQKQRQLITAIALVLGFALSEALMGAWSHSWALVAEAGHLVADSAALGLALWATLTTRPALKSGWIGSHTLEIHDRSSSETWAALINSVGLVVAAIWIGLEALAHLHQPNEDIAVLPMLLTAIVGVLVNGVNISILHSGSQSDLNLKGALLHVIADLMGSVGVIVAAVAVAVMHWMWADCAVGFVIAILMTLSAIPVMVQSGRKLFEF